MKTYKLLILLIGMLPLQLLAQYTLEGHISSADDNETLSGAHVILSPSGLHQVTGADGKFSFNKLKTGNYELSVSFIGFETQVLKVVLQKDTRVQLSLAPAAYLQDEIVVRSTRISDKTPLTYSLLDAASLQKKNTGVDFPYLLQQTPSLVVTSDAGAGIGYTGLRIRGTDLTRINVTLNGVPVNDAESHGVFFVDLPDLASSIDNVQIQRGVGTSTNGAAAFGASINIKTDSPSNEPFAAINSAAGSFNTLKNTLQFSTGRSANGFSLDGRLSKISSDGYIDRASSDLKSYYLSASWSNQRTLIKAIATSGTETTYQAWYGIPKDSLATNRTYNPAGEMLDADGHITGYYPNQIDRYQQDYYQLHMAHQLTENLTASGAVFLTKGKGYYENWKNSQKFSNYDLPAVSIGDESISRTDLVQQKWLDNDFYGFNLGLNYDHKLLKMTLGGGWNQYDGDHYGLITWAQYASASTNNWRWYDNTGLKTDYNVFAKTTYNLSQALSLFADLQYRHIGYKMEGIHDDLRDISQEHQFSFFNPKAGVYYSFNAHNSLYFSVSVSNREPNRSVYRDADLNQEVKSEQLVNYELGYKLQMNKLTLNSNVYYMDYNNQLVLTGKINNVGAAILTNVPESYRVGIENSLGWQLSNKLQLGMHLSLSSNKIKNFVEYVDNWNYWDNPDTEPYQYQNDLGTTDISFSPSVVAGSNIRVLPVKGLEINLQSNFVSRQYLDNTSNEYRSLDPYFVNNLIMDYTIPQKLFKHLGLTLTLNNLLNEQYEANGWVYKYVYDGQESLMDGYYPQAGFHWMMGLSVRF